MLAGERVLHERRRGEPGAREPAQPRIGEGSQLAGRGVRPDADGAGGTVVAKAAGRTTLTLAYQRRHAAGDYFDVFDDTWAVSQTVDIKVTGG